MERVNDYVFSEWGRYEIDHDMCGGFFPMRMAFDGRYKLTVYSMSPTDELYDMKEDPYEMKNLIDSEEHAEIRDRLHDAILDMMNRTRDPFRGWVWEQRPWRKGLPDPSVRWIDGFTRQREARTMKSGSGIQNRIAWIKKVARVKSVDLVLTAAIGSQDEAVFHICEALEPTDHYSPPLPSCLPNDAMICRQLLSLS
jgi:hypothetical protein